MSVEQKSRMRDLSDHTGDKGFLLPYRRVVRELIEKYEWALLQEDELVELVLGSAQPGISLAGLKRRAVHHYTTVLYEACRQDEDRDRREQAYHELFRYLFRAAYNRWPDLAEDVAQRALLLVYEQIDRCRHPGTFLAFALYKLQHAFQQELKARGRDWTDWMGEEASQGGAERTQAASLQSRLNQKERLRMLVEAIRRLPDARQRQAIVLKFFAGLGDEEISARLGVTVSNVRVLRHRGIVRLREDERLREYFEVTDREPV